MAPATLAALPAKLEALDTGGYAFAFVDTPPAITEAIRDVVKTADLVLIPVKPSPHDLRSVGGTVEIVQGQGKPFVFVVTQGQGSRAFDGPGNGRLSAHGRVAPVILLTASIMPLR